ncbi:hypothetical protein VTH82DRAFT_1312 [Thermothelomyces myriococcoides]
MQNQYGGGGFGYGPYGTGVGSGSPAPERGSRRKRLAAVAGSVYRAGIAAASELREQYNNTRARGVDMTGLQVSIPAAFPNVSIVTMGDEQMVLFPTYAKKHVRGLAGTGGQEGSQPGQYRMSDEEYWKLVWSTAEDEKAVVDVDVRGWIYMPNKGPMTRRNRMLVALARKLSGIPAPTVQSDEDVTEDQRVAREAQEIEKRGQVEKEVANRGGYSEPPGGSRGNNLASASPSPSPGSSARTPTVPQLDMTEQELAIANANLMARLGPFMTTPLVRIPITMFFYNESQSRPYTVTTDDSGHFNVRVPLDFVPTHVRVIANEELSTIRPIEVTGQKGISLISDIDDTIKQSNISMGAREIFRNALVRDLAELTVDGVHEWYNKMHDMGVKLHYCSNSPWQLYPVLATFLHTAGLPEGSMHLKHYSGMLQGIFEPVAERKKGTLEAIIRDFPERKFLLVGDSGEADLEVYTELAVANPGRILAIFIRDVTTPEQAGFFDPSFNVNTGQRSIHGNATAIPGGARPAGYQSERKPPPPPPPPPRATTLSVSPGPIIGDLISFSDPEPIVDTGATEDLSGREHNRDASGPGPPGPDVARRKPPPPRPVKPVALRSIPSDSSSSTTITNSQRTASAESEGGPALPARPRTSAGTPPNNSRPTPPPPPPPRRRGTAPATQQPRTTGDDPPVPDLPSTEFLPGMPGGYPAGVGDSATGPNGAGGAATTVNKKVDLWLMRLARAHQTLDAQGVKLYTWRRGQDVIAEAEGLVTEALKNMDHGN